MFPPALSGGACVPWVSVRLSRSAARAPARRGRVSQPAERVCVWGVPSGRGESRPLPSGPVGAAP